MRTNANFGVSGFRSQYLVLAKDARFQLRQYPMLRTTPRGFEPLRSKTTHLAGEPLNHSGKVSFCVPNHGYPTPQPYMGLKSTEKQTHSMSGNRTRGVCVTGRNVTNYTNTDMLSVKKRSTFLILRTPILKERGVPSRPKSHPSIILQWLSHIPSDIIGPNQYCGEPRPMLLVLIASLLSTLGLRCGAFNPWPFCSRFATSF